MGFRGMTSALLVVCLLAAAHPFTAARARDALALQTAHSTDTSLDVRKEPTALALVLEEGDTSGKELSLSSLLVDKDTTSNALVSIHSMADASFDSEEPEDERALALLALPETRPQMPPDTVHWYRWLGIRRELGAIPTGPAALASALASMARAKVFKSFIALIQRSGWRPVMQQYIRRVPVTMLAPTDAAMKAIPLAYRNKLKSPAVATKFVQYHCLQQLWPYKALGHWKLTSPYPTALGPPAWRMAHKTKVPFGTSKKTPPASQATIIRPDVSGTGLRLIVVEGINRALLHPLIFS